MNEALAFLEERRGVMLILSSPSGAGKTSISKGLLERDPKLKMSVSMTTRPPRPGEIDGIDYYFIDKESFKAKIDNQEFLEYAKVFGHYYGTPKKPVEDLLKQGLDVLFDIDWQGTQQICQLSKRDVASVFILPPSIDELKKRLEGRGQDSQEVINTRMASASSEISHWAEYDYIVINRELESSIIKVHRILEADRLRKSRQRGLQGFVRHLTDGLETYDTCL
jgi:guanylate kinase